MKDLTLADMDLYQIIIYNWSGSHGSDVLMGKFCIELKDKNSTLIRYLTRSLSLEFAAGNCWYELDVIAEMLQKLAKVHVCENCGTLIV